ncbi:MULTISPECIES: M20/M25/M40 family metallo-hydrolase [unclassified Synechococcus]|uniref:M20/M25/M40 family metallo-hydrolase n=1 Tax=Synechococcales TaxID=1890424 RepID=UPI001C88FF61|nr:MULTISPECIES: M20/M25/M40 family metallo-hydrolase [unclassified Synechococcus]
MDALPVSEATGWPFASRIRSTNQDGQPVGVMHACGQDTHMAAWVATLRRLASVRRDWSGTLMMIAQPAEELGRGAGMMLDDGLFRRFPKPDVVLALQTLVSREINPLESAVVSVGSFTAGDPAAAAGGHCPHCQRRSHRRRRCRGSDAGGHDHEGLHSRHLQHTRACAALPDAGGVQGRQGQDSCRGTGDGRRRVRRLSPTLARPRLRVLSASLRAGSIIAAAAIGWVPDVKPLMARDATSNGKLRKGIGRLPPAGNLSRP